MASRQGLRLEKSRRRDYRADDYGTYMLVDAKTNAVVASGLQSGYGLTLNDVERELTDKGHVPRDAGGGSAAMEKQHRGPLRSSR